MAQAAAAADLAVFGYICWYNQRRYTPPLGVCGPAGYEREMTTPILFGQI